MLAESLSQSYSKALFEKLILHLEPNAYAHKSTQAYTAEREGRLLHIRAGNATALAQAVARCAPAAKAGQLSDFTGTVSPKHSLRPLWPRCELLLKINERFGIALPSFFSDASVHSQNLAQHAERIARRLMELGYNALILGSVAESELELTSGLDYDLNELFRLLQKEGIELWVQAELLPSEDGDLSVSPLDPGMRAGVRLSLEDLYDELPDLRRLLWTSQWCEPEYMEGNGAEQLLIYDVLMQEVRLLESSLPPRGELIFHLPPHNSLSESQERRCLERLCDDLGPQSTLAFAADAVSGRWHSIWDYLRRVDDPVHTRLLPLFNAGLRDDGEGYWPNLPLRRLDTLLQRMHRHNFAGLAVLCGALPTQEGMAATALFVAGQGQWGGCGVEALLQTCLAAFRPVWDAELLMDISAETTEINAGIFRVSRRARACTAGSLDAADSRCDLEALLSRLNALHHRYVEGKGASETVSLSDYVRYYVRDSKRRIHHLLQQLGISLASVLNGDDLKEAVWTRMESDPGRGMVSGAQVTFLSRANEAADSERLRDLIAENRGL